MSERPVRLKRSWMYDSSTSQKYSFPRRLQNHEIHEIYTSTESGPAPCKTYKQTRTSSNTAEGRGKEEEECEQGAAGEEEITKDEVDGDLGKEVRGCGGCV